MPDDLGQYGQLFLTILTVVSSLIAGVMWGDRKRSEIRLKEAHESENRLRDEVKDREEDIADLTTKIERLSNRLDAVTAIKTNEAAIATVTEMLTNLVAAVHEHDNNAQSHWDNMAELMTSMIAKLGGVMEASEALVQSMREEPQT